MKIVTFILVVLGMLTSSTQFMLADKYEIPPTSTVSGSVPYISDKAMESCVKLYNEAKWLNSEIDNTQVNQYSQTSVDTYNNKVSQHSQMINRFNKECAGKQSKSAYEAAQKLNNQVKK